MDLFDVNLKGANTPLAERLRPKNLEDFVGQDHLVGEGSTLKALIETDDIPSMIFWGPPGTGKTTLAEVIANKTGSYFKMMSATASGKAELRKTVEEAIGKLKFQQQKTILFIDEIHRWSKTQQDALLPYVERGIITLIGATTENPSFEVVGALLSRTRVFTLKQLKEDDLLLIFKRALRLLHDEDGLKIKFEVGSPELLTGLAGGDARALIGAVELLLKTRTPSNSPLERGRRKMIPSNSPLERGRTNNASPPFEGGARGGSDENVIIRKEDIKRAYLNANVFYDKGGEEHFNIISALHKSMRGNDANASLYWLGRMLESGENPLYIARRLVRFASEDIGLADPRALEQAIAAYRASHYLGLPECNVCLAQAVVYLARAPKSNELYAAYGQVQKDIHEREREPVPLHLRNAPTKLMKELDYGKGYKYNPAFDEEIEQEYMPPSLKNKKYLNDL